MSFKDLFEFLDELNEHNHKDWMDENRKTYQEVKSFFKGWTTDLCHKLKELNPSFRTDPYKPKIFRINHNRMYNPNLPVYKDHFATELDSMNGTSFFYLEFGVKESLIAGGFYRPEKEILSKIRQAIDYDGEGLKQIANGLPFKEKFGVLEDEEMLKTMPRGYDKDHPHADLLRFRNFVVAHYPTRKKCFQPDFLQQVVELYREMIPFREYLDRAAAFDGRFGENVFGT